MKRIIFFLYLLFTTCYLSNGQNLIVRGLTIDSITKKPLCYSIISADKETCVIADSTGNFVIQVKDESDSCIVSLLGYYTKKVILNRNTDNIIELAPKTNALKTVDIYSSKVKTNNRKIGYRGKKFRGWWFCGIGDIVACYFPNHSNTKGYISNVGFYIMTFGHPSTKFRIRIFDLDTITMTPNNDILDTNLIVQSNIRGEWFFVDLRKYSISVPRNGFFVAMEWIPTAIYSPYNLSQYGFGDTTLYGQVLGGHISKRYGENTWSYTYIKGWYKSPAFAGINAEIIELFENKKKKKN